MHRYSYNIALSFYFSFFMTDIFSAIAWAAFNHKEPNKHSNIYFLLKFLAQVFTLTSIFFVFVLQGSYVLNTYERQMKSIRKISETNNHFYSYSVCLEISLFKIWPVLVTTKLLEKESNF